MAYKIVLASQSPRRQELLKKLGYDFETVGLNINESYPSDLKKEKITEFLAFQKSKHFGIVPDDRVVITADTIVWFKGRALEKPRDEEDAKSMILALSGKPHKVYTSVGFTTSEGFKVFTDCAKVYFLSISEKEAEWYVKNYSTLDKAGSYGIQDWLGLAKINKIKGSYFTIMGFPTHIVYDYLNKLMKKV